MIQVTDSTGIFKGKSHIVSNEHVQTVDAMAHAIAFKKPEILFLLSKYGIAVSDKPTNKELLNSLLTGFNKNKNMQVEFTALLFGKVNRFSNATDSPLFDDEGHPLTEGGVRSGSSDDPNACSWWARNFGDCKPYSASGTGTGTNSFGSVLTGVTGLLGLFGKPDTTALAQQTNAQILALAAEKEAARKRNNTIAIVAIALLIVGTVIGLVMYSRNKNNKNA